MVGADSKHDGSGAAGCDCHDLCEHIIRGRAIESWAAGKRGNAGITGSQARSFCWYARIWSTGTNDNPLIVVATLGWQCKDTGESSPSLQADGVATIGAIES